MEEDMISNDSVVLEEDNSKYLPDGVLC